MKIKQSFIDRCNDVTIKEVMAISAISNKMILTVMYAILEPQEHSYHTEIWKATGNVLKIDLKDIYEVEDLPHTL